MDQTTATTAPEQRHHPWFGAVSAPNLTCRWCVEPTAGFNVCRHCFHHQRVLGVADVVVPLTYAIAGTASAARLRDYKNHSSRTVRELHSDEIASLLRTALRLHEGCLERAVGLPIDLRATVPSLTLRPGRHPFARLVHAVTVAEEDLLVADPRADCHRVMSARKFVVPRAEIVAGRHVLVLDDLWTTGSNAQSAALALRAAGAAAVSVLVIGRWLNPSYPPTKAFLGERLTCFDPRSCPVTGDVCGPVSPT